MFRYASSFKASVIHPRTDVPVHAKSAQLDKEIAAQSTTNGHLGDPPGEQNEPRSHRGVRKVPIPPPKVTRGCHSLKAKAVLCSFFDALLCQRTHKSIQMFNKVSKIRPGQQTTFGKRAECAGTPASQNPKNMDSAGEWKQFAHSCKSADQWQNTRTN